MGIYTLDITCFLKLYHFFDIKWFQSFLCIRVSMKNSIYTKPLLSIKNEL